VRKCPSFAASFFTFNEAQEFLLDNLLSELWRSEGRGFLARRQKAKRGLQKLRQCNKDMRTHKHTSTDSTESCAIIWLISASKFIDCRCKMLHRKWPQLPRTTMCRIKDEGRRVQGEATDSAR